MPFVAVFYAALCAWTAVAAAYLGPEVIAGAWPIGRLLMMAFIIGFTWYFSLGIIYRVCLAEGRVNMVSLRRRISVAASDIAQIEGPRLAILPVGFLRIRIPGEKLYLFCRFASKDLSAMIGEIKRVNKQLTIKFLPS